MADERRLSLGLALQELLGNDHVYYQPPESLKIKYDCIIYNLVGGNTIYSDDIPYNFRRRYEITYITKQPDSELVDKLATSLPMIKFDRHFVTENLHHYTYTIYW